MRKRAQSCECRKRQICIGSLGLAYRSGVIEGAPTDLRDYPPRPLYLALNESLASKRIDHIIPLSQANTVKYAAILSNARSAVRSSTRFCVPFRRSNRLRISQDNPHLRKEVNHASFDVEIFRGDSVRTFFFTVCLFCQPQGASQREAVNTAEGLVNEIYRIVSAEAGKLPDWEKVRSLFVENAVVVLRVTRDSTAVFSVQGFIDDFINFYEKSAAKRNGFTERIVRMKPMVFGNIAHILVLYEAHIPGTPRPPQQGVDSWELVKRGGRWWIVAITNEIVAKDRPVPKELQE